MPDDSKPESPARSAPLTGALKSWWEPGLSVATTIVAALASTGLGQLGQAIALSVAAAAFAVTLLLWDRRRNRKSVLHDRVQAYRHWRERVSDSAFRGLYAFGRGDVLPGVERRRAAVALATSVKNERFRFGVISGDVGCGKTSFVNAVTSLLEESGFKVLVCEGLHGLHQAAPEGKADPDVAQVVSRLREDAAAKAGGDPFTLIIDQFEEFLIRYVLPGERQQLGSFLHQPIPGAESRVICAVRSDYLLEMHDLAPALPEPLSTRSLFRLRNFSIEEAEEVILECAERDEVPISREFATLIAHDLSHGSFVRPAELQIVCSALSGNPSLEAYKAASGAAAILSEYIKNALEISVDPQLARVVLRSFCDFDALPPAKAQPRTQAEIAEVLALDTGAQRRLGQILPSLEESRLVTSLPRDDHQALLYALVHDYLVGSIAEATGDLRTPNEVADQDLRGFIFQFHSDPGTRIPLRKIAPLKRLASRELLGSTEATDLLRRSQRSHLARAGLIALTVGLATGIVWGATALQPRWERVLIGRVDTGANGAAVFAEEGTRVWGVTVDTTRAFQSIIWDARTGRILAHDTVTTFSASPRRRSLLLTPAHGAVKLVDFASGKSAATPFSASAGNRKAFGPFPGLAFLSENLLLDYAELSPDSSTATARVWSLPEWKMVGSLANVEPLSNLTSIRVLHRADRLVFVADRDAYRAPFVWKISDQRDMRGLRPLISSSEAITEVGEVTVNEQETAMATIEHERKGRHRTRLCLWNLALETLTLCQDLTVPASERGAELRIFFSRDGSIIYVTMNPGENPRLIGVYRTEDLLPPIDPPPSSAIAATAFDTDSQFVAVWEGGGDRARLWRGTDHSTSSLRNFSVQTVLRMELSFDGRFLLVTRKSGQIELWDLARRVLIRRLQEVGPKPVATFTLDRQTIVVYSAGGVYTFYDGRSGDLFASLPIGGSPPISLRARIPVLPIFRMGSVIYHDAECRRFHVWANEGLVYRFQRGRDFPFRGFVPSRRTPRCR